MANTLRDKLIKNSTIELTDTLEDSKVFNKKDVISTKVPMINVALSGSLDGGLSPGVTLFAGPSKHFKSGFALLMAASFLNKYPDGIILFYDSEFGTPQDYFQTFGIPLSSVVHTPITDIEQLKFDIMKQLNSLSREDRVMIIVDSIGNLASKKEADDALEQNGAADMSRPKATKSLFRLITPHLTLKDIPFVAINHVYVEQKMYGKTIVSGGTGPYLSADNIWILGRQQNKDATEISGYNFVINIEKSRHVKEKSKILISIDFEGGINRWSGLFQVALDGGFIVKVGNKYALVDKETGEVAPEGYKRDDLEYNGAIWSKMIRNPLFKEYVESEFKITHDMIIEDDEYGE